MTEPTVDRLAPYFETLVHGETYRWRACGRSSSQPFDDGLLGYDHTMFACMGRGVFRVTLDEHRADDVGHPLQLSCRGGSVQAVYDELVARGANIVSGLTDQVWQMRDFVVEDLDGHRIRFDQPLS